MNASTSRREQVHSCKNGIEYRCSKYSYIFAAKILVLRNVCLTLIFLRLCFSCPYKNSLGTNFFVLLLEDIHRPLNLIVFMKFFTLEGVYAVPL